ncbi:serine hydrolase [Corynebacterium bouchesdurhonense]|uniref:hypothetical protein n=1 Tax=Corynebacterium bouchesdurhonense TaxID=1720192 RepID=UPI00082ADF5B|nr:hypothetical protein [Corynebacterium bouchesdurhonense]
MTARRCLLAACAAAALASACSAPAPEPALPEPTLQEPSTPSAPVDPVRTEAAGEGASASNAPLEAELKAIAEEVAAEYGGRLGIAVAGEAGVVSAGDAEATPAWSTIKVPIAVAALRADAGLYASAASAITVSDNTAAENLYLAAGPGAVNAVLAEAGLAVPLNTEVVRPEFSTFGQTLLTPAHEAQLAGSLACVDGAGDVLELMGAIDPGQAWGLGVLPGSIAPISSSTSPGARFKGGWGPGVDGAYQVRQLGLFSLADATFAAAALSAFPADGSFTTGQQMLTAAAGRLAQLEGLPPAPCQP